MAGSRDRDGAPPSRRRSIAGRLFGSLGGQAAAAAAGRDASAGPRRDDSSPAGRSPVPRIRQWLEACNADHGVHCRAPEEGPPPPTWRPPRLVDVVDRRLVVGAKPADGYAALSYVYGAARADRAAAAAAAAARLLSSNIDAFQLALPDAGVPRTILDAVWLARKLGLRYLWVDRLCVVDDDVVDRADHARHMAYVFANAYITIVAAHGDADTGLVALDHRRLPPAAAGPDSRQHDDLVLSSRWNTRCWTLQERLYARRAVYLFQDTVSWVCHCDVWQGRQTPRGKRHECADRVPAAALGFRHPPWPDLDEYARIAMDYSGRRLTLVDDTLPALSGITHVLSRVFPGGFVYGVPLMFLDAALLWRPQATIRRRALSQPPFLPSWSWLGWWFDGIPVDLTLWRAAADYIDETRADRRGRRDSKRFQASHSFRLRPMVTWQLTDGMHAAPVASTGLQYRDLRSRRSSGAALPPGWSRTGSHFRHESDGLTVFKYPVPVVEAGLGEEEGDDVAPGNGGGGGRPLPGPLLSFRTTAATFEVDYAISMVLRDKPNPPMAVGNIWSRADRWVGELRAHDGWLGVQSSNYDGGERLEFVSVSTAVERGGSYVFSAERFDEVMDADGVVEFVNVLWIERIANVAYRRGLGHIVLQAWEAEAVEVDVLLG